MEENRLTKKEKRELAHQAKQQDREKRQLLSKIKKLVLVVIPLLFVVWVGYKGLNYLKTPSSKVLSGQIEVQDGEWIKGEKEAEVTLIEYGDFQCPACANYEPIVERLLGEFPGKLRLVYRHFPLISIHKNSFASSKASEAASKQGKFWEMHDVLYERQKDWENSSDVRNLFSNYAKELGLDEEKFKSDFDSKEIEEKINQDMASGRNLGINSTPTFILNGQKVQPRSYEEFKSLVENQIKGYTLQ